MGAKRGAKGASMTRQKDAVIGAAVGGEPVNRLNWRHSLLGTFQSAPNDSFDTP